MNPDKLKITEDNEETVVRAGMTFNVQIILRDVPRDDGKGCYPNLRRLYYYVRQKS